jgi:choice-of-anchor B domain-containing protein
MNARLAVLILCAAACACAGDGGAPMPSPSPAADAPAGNMTLMAHLDLATLTATTIHDEGDAHVAHDELPLEPGAQNGAGNWGYTSPDGRRFALTGTSAGLSVVEVSDPGHARNVGLVPGPNSSWREVKTYGTYAYVTTEAKHGLDIVDLADPDHPRLVRTYDETFKSAHTLWIDAERRLLFANGAGTEAGRTGLHVLSLDDPEQPREIGRFTDFYVHDSFTRGGVLFASAIYDGFQSFVDVSDPRSPRELSRFFTGGRFTHSAALTPDGRFLFTTDEVPGAPLECWDVGDPAQPRKVGEFIARAGTIPHNVLVDGTRLLVSHYTMGVYLLDVADPSRPRALGWYDTYDGEDAGFHGNWGAYLFPGSNLIVASDIEGGLFVVRYDGR